MTTTGRWDWNRVDVTVPVRLPAPGVRMAGFRYRDVASVDITMIPHPSVTLLLDLSEVGVVYDVLGRLVTGNVIVGLRAGALRITGAEAGEVLQIRMSPVVAARILRDADIIGGTVIPLPELWGSSVGILTERLRSTPSWDDRFALAAAFLRSRLPRGYGMAPEIAYTWDRTIGTKACSESKPLPQRPAGPGSGSGPASVPISGFHPNMRPNWSASTVPPIFWPQGAHLRTPPPRPATSTNPIFTVEPRRSPT